MTLLVATIAALLAGCLGALGGRALVRREIGDVLRTAAYSSQRANVAAATVEDIAAEWPGVLEHVQELDDLAHNSARSAQAGQRAGGEALRRQAALEQAVAGALNLSLTRGGLTCRTEATSRVWARTTSTTMTTSASSASTIDAGTSRSA